MPNPLPRESLPPVPEGCKSVRLPCSAGDWWIDIGDESDTMFGPNDAPILRAMADWLDAANGVAKPSPAEPRYLIPDYHSYANHCFRCGDSLEGKASAIWYGMVCCKQCAMYSTNLHPAGFKIIYPVKSEAVQPSPWRKQSEEKAPVNIVVLTRDIVKRTKTLHLGQFVADYEEWMPILE